MAISDPVDGPQCLYSFQAPDSPPAEAEQDFHYTWENDESFFACYISTLIAAIFFIIPGIVNTLFGLILMSSSISLKLVRWIMRILGIQWAEVHEYLTVHNLIEE